MAHTRPAGVALIVAILLVACDPSSIPSVTASPSGLASRPAGGVTGPGSPEPSPLPTARPLIRANAVGSIPALFRYVALDTPLADGVHTRLWLIDLSSKRAPALAAEWDAPVAPVGGYSASGDGRTVIVSAAATRSRVALSVLMPETGGTRTLFEDPGYIVISPRVSPDGARFAFTKYPAAGGSDLGIWAGRIVGGDLSRLTDPSTGTTVPQMPLGWSWDASWLAFTREVSTPIEEYPEVHVVRAGGGTEMRIGTGDKVSWHRIEPQLLVASSGPASSLVYAVDLSGALPRTIDVTKLDKVAIPTVAWHPTAERFVYVAAENAGREASGGIWMVELADPPVPIAAPGRRRLDANGAFFAPEWSADGSVLSALAGGDDARIPIVDLLGGRQLSVLCRRGGTPPADCL